MQDSHQTESSMEDILDSIRKIISTDGDDEGTVSSKKEENESKSSPQRREDVIELTDEVQGSDHIDHNETKGRSVDAEISPGHKDASEEDGSPKNKHELKTDLKAPQDHENDQNIDPMSPSSDAVSPSGPQKEISKEEGIREGALSSSKEAKDSLAEKGNVSGDINQETSPQNTSEIKTSKDEGQGDALVDDDVAASTANVIETLQKAFSSPQAVKAPKTSFEDISLVDFLNQMIKPELKTWLDKNLKKLVEEVVEKEIRNIVDRNK